MKTDDQLLRNTVTKYANILSRHIVTIFHKGRFGALEACSSGFLVSTSSNAFVISAAHVFDPLANGDSLCFYAERKRLREVSGRVRVTKTPSGKTRKYDRIDLGACMLEA
jgi:hypothetical protein